jgi:hypothetical protein
MEIYKTTTNSLNSLKIFSNKNKVVDINDDGDINTINIQSLDVNITNSPTINTSAVRYQDIGNQIYSKLNVSIPLIFITLDVPTIIFYDSSGDVINISDAVAVAGNLNLTLINHSNTTSIQNSNNLSLYIPNNSVRFNISANSYITSIYRPLYNTYTIIALNDITYTYSVIIKLIFKTNGDIDGFISSTFIGNELYYSNYTPSDFNTFSLSYINI